MASYHRREITTTRVEFLVPTNEPWGACWVEVEKAISEIPSDDRIRLHCADEAIAVSYERREP